MNALGLDLQSAFGLPPVEYVNLAADLGCGHLTTGLIPLPWNPCGFKAWSLRDDPALRREMLAAMRDRAVSLSVGAGFSITPAQDVSARAADMDLMVELGARSICTVGMEPDLARAHDQLARLAAMAAAREMDLILDFAPCHPIGTLEAALAAIRHTGAPNARLSIDAMHFFRSGATVAQLLAVGPDLIGYAQLCDVPLVAVDDDYLREATLERRVPGDGDLPLQDFVAALPADLLFGVEVPMLSQVRAGTELRTILGRAVAASRDVLGRVARADALQARSR